MINTIVIWPTIIALVTSFVILISPLWPVSKGPLYERKENAKKFGIFFLSSVLISGLICSALWFGGTRKMYYSEVWNNKIMKLRHEEKWTTHETRTETYTTGSGKNQQTHIRVVHYTDTHGPYWKAFNDQGRSHSVNSEIYNQWLREWGDERKVGVNKGSSAGLDQSISGDILEITWPGSFETIFPWPTIHRYKNKVRQSDSVLKLGEPTKELREKYPRPVDEESTEPYWSYNGGVVPDMDLMLLRRVNAFLGATHEIHALLVVFPKNTPRSAVYDVLTAWEGPNKNELVTFISLDETTVEWCEVHSWMDNKTLHGVLRDEITRGPFSTKKYASLLRELVPQYWHRKEFEDFEYLQVNIHAGWLIATIVLTIAVNAGVFLFLQHAMAGSFRYSKYRSYGNLL